MDIPLADEAPMLRLGERPCARRELADEELGRQGKHRPHFVAQLALCQSKRNKS